MCFTGWKLEHRHVSDIANASLLIFRAQRVTRVLDYYESIFAGDLQNRT